MTKSLPLSAARRRDEVALAGRRARANYGCCRVVFLDQMAAFIVTPNDVNFAAEFHRRDLGARRGHGRSGDPFAGQLGRRLDREGNGHEETE